MADEPPTADHAADHVLPLDGPHKPDRVIAAARTIDELVRRLNHATRHRPALSEPEHLWHTVIALASTAHRLEQTLGQLAARLDAFAADPRVMHDERHSPTLACTAASAHLRQAAATIRFVAAPLDEASQLTGHLGYDTAALRRPVRGWRAAPAPQPPPVPPSTRPAPRHRTR